MTLPAKAWCIKCGRPVAQIVCPDYPECSPIPLTVTPKMFTFHKLGNGRPEKVCSALNESDWLFVVRLNGVEIGHVWQPALRVTGMPGFCPSEGYKGAYAAPDGSLQLAQTGKNHRRPRVYHNTRPEAAMAVYQCYHQARVTE